MTASQIKFTALLSFSLVLFFSTKSQAQDGRLIGLADNHLVEVNPLNGDLTILTPVNIPNGVTVRKITFSPQDCKFYAIIDLTTNPTLVSFDFLGNYSEIGALSTGSTTVFMAEALAYNQVDNKLYAAVSLNGGPSSGDFNSETILEVNPLNADITIKTELDIPGAQPDIDNMVFTGNELYIIDGLPNQNMSNFYKLNFAGLGAAANPDFVFSNNYFSIRDMASMQEFVFAPTSDLDFYKINIAAASLEIIGMAELNGQPLNGLEYVEINQVDLLETDTTLCQGEDLTLTIDWAGASIFWNTGLENNSITVDSPGMYWANIFVDDCFYTTDTAIVDFEICDTCTVIYNQIAENLGLGNDTILCDFEKLELSIEPGINATVAWNTTEIGNTITANHTGWYWADILYGDCVWTSDSVFVLLEPCDTCQFAQAQIQDLLFIGNDTTVCEDEEVWLEIDLDAPYMVYWNNGEPGFSATATLPGTYWANIFIGDCIFPSDSLTISSVNCDACNFYIPNVFTPEGDGLNDVFQVYFNEVSCNVVSIEMSIFDRWGEMVIQTNKNEWDGNLKGTPVGVGVYVYLIQIEVLQDGKPIQIIETGDVAVFK